VTETTAPIAVDQRTSTAPRVGWAILILGTLYICYFSHLGAIGFVGPDEPRYAWIARDMAETGDWVTPRLYGKPWFEKPPLFYWGAALCFKLFGVSEAAARLPSAVSALLATLALAWLALRLYGTETALWLLLLLPTTAGMIGFSHAASTDMPFSAMLTTAMVCAAVVLGLTRNENSPIIPQTPWLALVLFGFFLGLAVLAKGPAGIILVGGAVFLWALFTKRWRDAFRLFHPAALASFCLTALPWYIFCARRNPDFFHIFIIEHNFKRYLTPEFQHTQPFWFYGSILLLAFLPWTAIFLWSLIKGIANLWRTRCIVESTWLLICWAGFYVLFFSVSQSKLPGYILPAVPAIGLLMTRGWTAFAQAYTRSLRLVLLMSASCFYVLFGLVSVATPRFSPGNQKFGIAVGLIVAAMATANLLLGIFVSSLRVNEPRRLVAASCILPILLAVSLMDKLLPSLFLSDPSGRSLAHELQVRKIPADKLAVAWMNRGLHYSLNFYLREEVRIWDEEHPTEGYLIAGSKICKRLAPPPFACEEIPIDAESTGKSLYRVSLPSSAGGLPRSGQPQQEK
jgi:4-amino-4-deoxy-L-arabinose transferase-like glycosyltransferase